MYLREDPEDPNDPGDYRQFGGVIKGDRIHFPDDKSLEAYQAYKARRKAEKDEEGD